MEPFPIDVQLKTLPENPGVYQFFDAEGKILYVGKAKNLKKRVGTFLDTRSGQGAALFDFILGYEPDWETLIPPGEAVTTRVAKILPVEVVVERAA